MVTIRANKDQISVEIEDSQKKDWEITMEKLDKEVYDMAVKYSKEDDEFYNNGRMLPYWM